MHLLSTIHCIVYRMNIIIASLLSCYILLTLLFILALHSRNRSTLLAGTSKHACAFILGESFTPGGVTHTLGRNDRGVIHSSDNGNESSWSIINKHDEISNYLTNQISPTILGISETWLNKNTPDSLINIEGYSTFRLDRKKSRGGGLVVYVPNTLKVTLREDLNNNQLETIWIELNLNRQSILLCNLYRPPNSGIAFFDYLDSMIESSLNCKKEIIIMGDFNCNVMTSNPLSSNLLSVTDGHQLTQIISGPTRITNHSKTLIDLCFTSSPNSLSHSGTTSLTRLHLPVAITLWSTQGG